MKMPMKMEPIMSSETSVIRTQTPGNYPKRNNLHFTVSLVSFSTQFNFYEPCYSHMWCSVKMVLLTPAEGRDVGQQDSRCPVNAKTRVQSEALP